MRKHLTTRLVFTAVFLFLVAFHHPAAAQETGDSFVGVKVKGKWGYADRTGAVVVAPKYDEVLAFSEGIAPAKRGPFWGLINLAGAWVVDPVFTDIGTFASGLAPVKAGEYWGFIDLKGQFAIAAKYREARAFSEGRAAVLLGKLWGFIDTQGELVIKPTFDVVRDFRGGTAAVESNKAWGFIDASGAYVIRPSYQRAKPFTDGLAAVLSNGKWGYIFQSGETAIPHKFDLAANFSNGYAGVEVDDLAFAIDSTGKMVGRAMYEWPIYFSDGLSPAAPHKSLAKGRDAAFGYLNTSGSYEIENKFELAGPFKDGVAWVRIGDLFYCIDRQGGKLNPTGFDDVEDFDLAQFK